MSPSVEEKNFKSFDETELFSQAWTPDQKPKALVIGTHGLGEHADSYRFLGNALTKKNYKLIMFDHRGHGRSEGKRGVGTIDEFVLDLKVFIDFARKNNPDLPFFFIAHSMGALVLIKYLIRNGFGQSKGAVFSSPMLGVSVEIPAWKKKISGALAVTLPRLTLFNEIPPGNLSHDPVVVKSYGLDHLRHDRISAPLFISMLESIDYCFKHHDKLDGPMYFQVAGTELVVSRPETEKFYALLTRLNKEMKIYEGFHHEIYNELKRDEVFADLTNWLDKKLI